jgi:putative Mg2+ transporter-C (MgtC) family protein
MEILADLQLRIFFQLLLALLLGGILGLEREYKKREAGLRTYALVSLGSALFTIIAFESFNILGGKEGLNFDPARIVQAIAIGIGFLGGGIIIYRRFHIEGVTTAAGLWIAAGVGIAVGAQFYWPAILTTLLTVSILIGFYWIEKKFFWKKF